MFLGTDYFMVSVTLTFDQYDKKVFLGNIALTFGLRDLKLSMLMTLG